MRYNKIVKLARLLPSLPSTPILSKERKEGRKEGRKTDKLIISPISGSLENNTIEQNMRKISFPLMKLDIGKLDIKK